MNKRGEKFLQSSPPDLDLVRRELNCDETGLVKVDPCQIRVWHYAYIACFERELNGWSIFAIRGEHEGFMVFRGLSNAHN